MYQTKSIKNRPLAASLRPKTGYPDSAPVRCPGCGWRGQVRNLRRSYAAAPQVYYSDSEVIAHGYDAKPVNCCPACWSADIEYM